jgi:hypothetical protein
MSEPAPPKFHRQWRYYRTQTGGQVARKELDALETDGAAALLARCG